MSRPRIGGVLYQSRPVFQESIDDYLEFCGERGKIPKNLIRGKFIVRVEPELYKRLAIEARKRGVSINVLVSETLSKTINEDHGSKALYGKL